jgi:hypothetical protein
VSQRSNIDELCIAAQNCASALNMARLIMDSAEAREEAGQIVKRVKDAIKAVLSEASR